ncbi:MAG: S1 RNA-binding domain-containing protein, partial [Deltaproteobacteria bacterium]|nr:S1 RNA-binding domain-containing protein [Deltaproteobacteria bacterium]
MIDERQNGGEEEVMGLENGEMEENFADLFENSLKELVPGTVVRGTIVQVNDDSVVVDVGAKSEGVIAIHEFQDEQGNATVSTGDQFDVYIENTENENGLISLSKVKAERQKIWSSLEENMVIEGRILARVKGGLSV